MGSSSSLEILLLDDQASMRETLRFIDRNEMGIAFVVNAERQLRGVVTDGDVRRAILAGMSLESNVETFMTRNPVTAKIGTTTDKIFGLMDNRVKFVPMLDAEDRIVEFASFSQRSRFPVAAPSFQGNELRYVTECVVTNWISSQGRFVTEFESGFSEFCGVDYGIAVTNGTTALHLALLIAGVGPQDEVIVPTLTFIAPANAVRYTGATPVFVDSEWESWNLDPQKLEAAITSRTKVIIVVHLYGHPALMDSIMDIAERHHLIVIEDSAEAHGARYKSRRVGSIGHIGCFSFFGNKIMTTGEGGMITTSRKDFADEAKMLRDHAMSKTQKYWHEKVGFNYRMTNLQAAIGVAQLEQIDHLLGKRNLVASNYRKELGGDDRIQLPPMVPDATPVNWLFTILLDGKIDRNRVIERLSKKGVDCRPVFYPVHHMPPYQTNAALPIAESISQRGISLPVAPTLTEDDVGYISGSLLASL